MATDKSDSELYVDNDSSEDCDSCFRSLVGLKHISGINSCCGGGCYRRLCFDCVRLAVQLIEEQEDKK